MERVKDIIDRITSKYFAQLWQFYRDAFTGDEECLEFFYDVINKEPKTTNLQYLEKDDGIYYIDDNGDKISDSVFVPRRMLNATERMVSAAKDMEIIRRGKDVFKIVYIVTCAETLQKLAGRDKDAKGEAISKKNLLFDFFEKYTPEIDKQYLASRFKHDDEEKVKEQVASFKQFVGVINEYRNCAAHEGDYWNYCFNNNDDGYPISLVVRIDLENFSGNECKKREHCFTTEISYADFEKIFIRTCVAFIRSYVEEMNDTN